jgi:glucose/arabinose dehydrogenase
MTRRPVSIALILLLIGCGDRSRLPLEAGIGPNPTLPKPSRSLFPTIKVADAQGWPSGGAPVAAPGTHVNAFARGLDHPRWLLVLANGDVLVAESAAPPKPEQYKDGGIRAWFQKLFMKKAGSAVPSPNRITLLRDADGDGSAEQRSILLANLRSPFGMAVVGDRLFVANADSLVSFPFRVGQTRIDEGETIVARLPAGRNHHWTKSLAVAPDGKRLFVGVGSNSNVGENGLDEEIGRAAILEIDAATGATRIFASGLRNPVGLEFNPWTRELWTSVNERDELGSDLVPDYMTAVRSGGFYGWPWSYFGPVVDTRVKPPRPDMVARAIKPDYALGSHTASLGLTFSEGQKIAPRFDQGAFIGQHGSWNRNPPSGYKVIFVAFDGGRPSGMPVDVLTGFLGDGVAYGRPVGVEIGRDGSLLVADDVGDVIWRVSAASSRTASPGRPSP